MKKILIILLFVITAACIPPHIYGSEWVTVTSIEMIKGTNTAWRHSRDKNWRYAVRATGYGTSTRSVVIFTNKHYQIGDQIKLVAE